MELLLVLCLAFCTGRVFKALKISAPFMLGALLGTAVYAVFFPIESDISAFKTIAQALTGTYIGTRMSFQDIKRMKSLILPSLFSVGCLIIAMLFSAVLLNHFFGFDVQTALLSAVPGGLADITLMSYDFQADTTVVTLFQTSRMFFILVSIPIVVGLSGSKNRADARPKKTSAAKKRTAPKDVLLTLIVGVTGALIGWLTHFPAAVLSLSMVAVVLYNSFTQRAVLPIEFRYLAQVLSGVLVGSGITMAFLQSIYLLIIPLVIVLFIHLLNNAVNSYLLTRLFKLNFLTCIFSTAPAGASDMVLIAADMDLGDQIDKNQIVFMHLVRLFLVLTLFPVLIRLILTLF